MREKIQLQCKQAERTVDDLKMELQNTNQAREELAKQVKLAQVLICFAVSMARPVTDWTND